MSSLADFAKLLDDAAARATSVDPIDPDGKLTLPQAYIIQADAMHRRLERGERRTGVKMGFTSRSKMLQMGIDDMIWGRLSNAMQVAEGDTVSLAGRIHPRVEPELAFVLKHDLPGDANAVQALAAVEAIAPALEIIDSRYRDFKFNLPEVVADNASASGYVIGAWSNPRTDFGNLGLLLTIDGHVTQVGSTAAILGHPLRSLVAAARLSAAAGEPLQAGWVIMAGGATAAEWLLAGQHVCVEMERLGSAGFHVRD